MRDKIDVTDALLAQVAASADEMTEIATNPDSEYALTIGIMQWQAFGTSKSNGFHDEDDQPPSEAVLHVARLGLRIGVLCEAIEKVRKGQEPPDDEEQHESYMDMQAALDGCSPLQQRAVAWMALICTEAAEAIDDILCGNMAASTEGAKPTGLPSELADVVVRVGDAAGALGIDLEEAVRVKMAFNTQRGYRHGGKKV